MTGDQMPDVVDYEVRVEALRAASRLLDRVTSRPGLVIDHAKQYEAYLRGEDT